MKIAIVGSRDYADLDAVRRYILTLPNDAIVVSGGARGVDMVAVDAAVKAGFSVEVFPALWGTYGKRAGFVRNRQIVEAASKVVAFWDGVSKGTANTILLAREAGKPVEIVRSS